MGWMNRICHIQRYTWKEHSKNLGDILLLNYETCISLSLFNKMQEVKHMTNIKSFVTQNVNALNIS